VLAVRPPVPSVHDTFYSPQRDLANLGPHLVRMAAFSLDSIRKHDPELQAWLDAQGVTEDQLCAAAQQLARALLLLQQQKHHHQALADIGFDAAPFAVRMALFAKMGQCLLAAIWSSVKDQTTRRQAVPTTLADVVHFTEDVLAKHRETLRIPVAD
jgi:hypothetical protein